MEGLEALNLADNPIQNVEPGAFASANLLSKLVLSDTGLRELSFSGASFQGLKPCYRPLSLRQEGLCVRQRTDRESRAR